MSPAMPPVGEAKDVSFAGDPPLLARRGAGDCLRCCCWLGGAALWNAVEEEEGDTY